MCYMLRVTPATLLILTALTSISKASPSAPLNPHAPFKIQEPQPGKTEDSAKFQGFIPEGKTLPKGVGRLRIPYQDQQGDSGFDGEGKKTVNHFRASGTGSALVLEYGVTDRLSVQLLTRYFHSQSIQLDSRGLETEIFSKFGPGVNRSNLLLTLSQGAAKALASQGACGGRAEVCLTAIDQNLAKAPVDLTEANTGLKGLNIKAGESIKEGLQNYTQGLLSRVDAALVRATQFEKRGAQGMGDSELGILYEAFTTDKFRYAIGAGVRLPTGQCQELGFDERATSRCTLDAALRHNVDVIPTDYLMVSWQHQTEQMLRKGAYSAYTFDDQTSPEILDVKRDSARQVGFLIGKPTLTPLHQSLAVVTAKYGLAYDYDSELASSGNQLGFNGSRNSLISRVYGMGLDGLPLGIPATLETERTEPISGENKAIAVSSLTTTLKVYMRF